MIGDDHMLSLLNTILIGFYVISFHIIIWQISPDYLNVCYISESQKYVYQAMFLLKHTIRNLGCMKRFYSKRMKRESAGTVTRLVVFQFARPLLFSIWIELKLVSYLFTSNRIRKGGKLASHVQKQTSQHKNRKSLSYETYEKQESYHGCSNHNTKHCRSLMLLFLK